MSFDLEIFDAQLRTVTTELVDQQVSLFNAASRGAITMAPTSQNEGDFAMRSGFRLIGGMVRRRDVANGTNPVAAVRLGQMREVSVKVAAGTPPINYERAQYDWVKQDSATAATVIGEQLAMYTMQDHLNTAVSALAAAITARPALVTDVSAIGAGTTDVAALAQGAGKFGDRMGAITCWVVHSKVMTDLFVGAIANNTHLFSYGTVNIRQDPFGRVFVITDSPALIQGGKYVTLGLVDQAALVEPNNDFRSVTVETTGTENIQTSFQAEWSFNLSLLGYAWDRVAGGPAPSDTALGTGANWQQLATSAKDTAGVAILSL